MLTKAELEVAGELLDVVSERLIAPYDLPNSPENMAIVNAARGKADPQPEGVSIPANVNELAGYFSNRLQHEALALEEAAAAASSIDALLPIIEAELDGIRKRWHALGRNADGTENEERAVAVLVASHVALKKLSLVTERLTRPIFLGQRNNWREIEKSIEQTVDEWFKRPADGSLGLRRVK